MTDATFPMLRAILDLAAFHRAHEQFYASEPREHAVRLQEHARTLRGLADDWTVPVSLQAPPSVEGVLFREDESQPAAIVRLGEDLRAAARAATAAGETLAAAMEASWDVAAALVEIDELADELGERHRIITDDWQAAHLSALAGRLLDRAADLLDHVDCSARARRAEPPLAGAPGRLTSAAELTGRAADLCGEAAGLVQENERRWRAFRTRVEELVGER